MRMALALAEEAGAAGEIPVGCVIVRDGQVVGRGRNRREEKGSALSHAEGGGHRPRPTPPWGTGGWRTASSTSPWSPAPCAPGPF